MINHNLKISYDKSRVINLRRPKYLKRHPTIKMDNRSIKQEKTLQYLGITIDNTLSFLPHLRQKRQEINSLTQDLLKFASAYGGVSKSILKIWYHTILEKKVTYASATWYNRIKNIYGEKLISSIQYQCLLLISRAYKQTSTAALCTLTGIPPLNLQIKKTATEGRVLRLGLPTENHNPSLYENKENTSHVTPYKEYLNILEEEKEDEADIQIYTDGSKLNNNTGYAYCVYKSNKLIREDQTQLRSENTVYQAELLAIEEAITWANTSHHKSATIYSDSQSGITALTDIFSRHPINISIITLLQETTIKITFKWIKGHNNNTGNDRADGLAKDATKETSKAKRRFYPYPPSSLKKELKTSLMKRWQEIWDYGETGRYTQQLMPKVKQDRLLPHRNLYIFATNHGPFFSYLHKINRVTSPLCVCGLYATSLHYITQGTLTSHYHIRKPQQLPMNQWFSVILSKPNLYQKIIDCVRLLEKNQIIFQNPEPYPPQDT